MTQSNRAYLRRQTQSDHARVDLLYWGPTGFFSRSAYDCLISRLYTAHRDLGGLAVYLTGSASDFDVHCGVLSALRADMDRDVFSKTQQTAPQTPSFAWGVRYALTGASAGAKMILGTGLWPKNWPRSYLECAKGLATSGHLKRTFEQLDAAQIDLPQAADGARAVFSQLDQPLAPAQTTERLAHAPLA